MAASAEGSSVAEASPQGARNRASVRFAWLAVALAGWVIGGVFLVVRALNLGLATDVGLSPYHVVSYLALVVLAGLSLALVGRAIRRGRPWRDAFPEGYGTLGAGVVVLLVYIVADVAWREGIGIATGVEGGLAPSRVLLVVGLALIAIGPLRAAILAEGRAPLLPAVISAGLVLTVIGIPGGYQPAMNPWLEHPPDTSADNSEIWLMDADGRNQLRFIEAADGVELTFPVWSPDASQLAYVRWTGASRTASGDPDIWVANADGRGQRALATGDRWQWLPRWSPDGTTVSYTDEAVGGPWMAAGPVGRDTGSGPLGPGFDPGTSTLRPDADLWRISADGSGPGVPMATTPGDDRSGSWSPDGQRIAFDATRDGNTEIYAMNADGSNPVRLTDNPAEDWAPSWSPDGTRIAFVSDRSGIAQIFLTATDGSGVVQLTDDIGGNVGPAWSPDGARITFQSWRASDQEIWSMAADGTDPQNLSRSPSTTEWVWDGSWGSNGRIAFPRSSAGPASADALARNDLGAAALLLQAGLVALVSIVLISIRPPFGSFALVLGIATAFAASQFDEWRFVPSAVVGGLAVDIAVRLAPARWTDLAAAVVAPTSFVLGAAAAVIATTGLEWTPTLLLGVALTSGLIGGALARLITLRPALRGSRRSP